MKEKAFTGKTLESALNENSFEQVRPDIQLVGMVKKSDKEGYVSFTQSGCGTWVDLPSTMIERAEFIENRTCKDHSHPVMKIVFKHSDNPEYEILLSLLQMTTQSANSNNATMNQLDSRNIPYGLPMENLNMSRVGGMGGMGITIQVLKCDWDWVPCTRCAFGHCWESHCLVVSNCRWFPH
jgi:hypothetical protein